MVRCTVRFRERGVTVNLRQVGAENVHGPGENSCSFPNPLHEIICGSTETGVVVDAVFRVDGSHCRVIRTIYSATVTAEEVENFLSILVLTVVSSHVRKIALVTACRVLSAGEAERRSSCRSHRQNR